MTVRGSLKIGIQEKQELTYQFQKQQCHARSDLAGIQFFIQCMMCSDLK